MQRTSHWNQAACLALMVLALGAVVHAQGTLTGKWQGETNNGTPIALDLTVKEEILTGTIVRSGESHTISDGKLSGNTFAFKATINGQAEGFSGELAGRDQIKVWLERQGPAKAIVLNRVKTK
jgi:hypothetical protein